MGVESGMGVDSPGARNDSMMTQCDTHEVDIATNKKEEALDIEEDERKDFSGSHMGFQETLGELLLELEDESEEIEVKIAKMIRRMDSTLNRVKCSIEPVYTETSSEYNSD